MLSHAAAERAEEFHVILVSGGEVAAESAIGSVVEADAFSLAKEMVDAAAARGVAALSAYVLDGDQVFRGSVEPTQKLAA